MKDMETASVDEIARELRAAQASFRRIETIRERRRAAVLVAIDAGWRPSRIAREMNVDSATVTAILAAATPKPAEEPR